MKSTQKQNNASIQRGGDAEKHERVPSRPMYVKEDGGKNESQFV